MPASNHREKRRPTETENGPYFNRLHKRIKERGNRRREEPPQNRPNRPIYLNVQSLTSTRLSTIGHNTVDWWFCR